VYIQTTGKTWCQGILQTIVLNSGCCKLTLARKFLQLNVSVSVNHLNFVVEFYWLFHHNFVLFKTALISKRENDFVFILIYSHHPDNWNECYVKQHCGLEVIFKG